MTRSRTRKTVPLILLWASLLLTIGAHADSVTQPSSANSSDPTNDRAKEFTFTGAIQERSSGASAPSGLHLYVSTPQGTVDAHLGPYLSKEIKEALQVGQLVQVTGVVTNIHDKPVLLTRQLIFSGRVVNVRNARGFLIPQLPARHPRDSKIVVNGGAQ